MKKKLICGALLLATALPLISRTRIIRSGSGDGIHYETVRETHGWFNHTLECRKPGNTTCGWTISHKIHGNTGETEVSDIETWIETQIEKGIHTGVMLEYNQTGIRVSWISDGTDRDIEIYDYE